MVYIVVVISIVIIMVIACSCWHRIHCHFHHTIAIGRYSVIRQGKNSRLLTWQIPAKVILNRKNMFCLQIFPPNISGSSRPDIFVWEIWGARKKRGRGEEGSATCCNSQVVVIWFDKDDDDDDDGYNDDEEEEEEDDDDNEDRCNR